MINLINHTWLTIYQPCIHPYSNHIHQLMMATFYAQQLSAPHFEGDLTAAHDQLVSIALAGSNWVTAQTHWVDSISEDYRVTLVKSYFFWLKIKDEDEIMTFRGNLYFSSPLVDSSAIASLVIDHDYQQMNYNVWFLHPLLPSIV